MESEREAPSHDEHGDSIDARGCQYKQTPRVAQSVSRENDGSHATETQNNGRQARIESSAENHLPDATISPIAAYSVNVTTTGPIPNAAEFNAYPESVQSKIIEWHDREINASFDDESMRQNRLVNAEIRGQARNKWLSFIVDIVLIIAPIVAFCVTGNPSAFWAYTVLGASIIGNVVINVNSMAKNDKHVD